MLSQGTRLDYAVIMSCRLDEEAPEWKEAHHISQVGYINITLPPPAPAPAPARPLEVGRRRRRRRRRPLFCRIAKKMPPAVIGDQTHSESVEKGGARLPHDVVWPWPGWASRGRKEKKMNVNVK